MTTVSPALEPCPGCGRLYPRTDGPTHAYIGASAGCWARYGELLALEYGDSRLMRWHRLTVDVYAAQHPGVPERRSAQSVHVHLAGLYLSLERGLDPPAVAWAMQRLADGRTHGWLEPPPLATAIGVPELIEAAGGPHYGERARAWAEAVWQAWAPHHAAIRAEAEAALTSH
ncbi:MAG: hypothetical protein QOK17_584 [Sphingomonadales bacterium]|jgi:hypothetical protein|nr:hypothetical protein [Sphingomonadales bacterium]